MFCDQSLSVLLVLCMQDYHSLHAAVTICAIVVNTEMDSFSYFLSFLLG